MAAWSSWLPERRRALRRLSRFAVAATVSLAVVGMLGVRIVRAAPLQVGPIICDGIDDQVPVVGALSEETSKRWLPAHDGKIEHACGPAGGEALGGRGAIRTARFEPRPPRRKCPSPRRAPVSIDSPESH